MLETAKFCSKVNSQKCLGSFLLCRWWCGASCLPSYSVTEIDVSWHLHVILRRCTKYVALKSISISISVPFYEQCACFCFSFAKPVNVKWDHTKLMTNIAHGFVAVTKSERKGRIIKTIGKNRCFLEGRLILKWRENSTLLLKVLSSFVLNLFHSDSSK